MTWRERALCQAVPEMPWENDGKPTVEQLRVCLACPVLRDCAGFAESAACKVGDDAGVLAASNPTDRQAIREGRRSWEDVWARARRRVEVHDELVGRRVVRWMLVEAGRMADRVVSA
ncbi:MULTISPECIES: WhiB family transcriptional regulator [unclassified Egicoccus]|uniref:WhiB family transcriptional regulator n=1 Tax=unclassified Egicoccus TaxID=2635606 RepID=UPI00359E97A3